jgi:hypothetical protein
VPPRRLVFLDESGLNCSMTRSHAWVQKGSEYIKSTPMNWGKNRTLLGAMRMSGWVLLTTMFASTNKERFVQWLAKRLLPRLKRGDVPSSTISRLIMMSESSRSAPLAVSASYTFLRTRTTSILSSSAAEATVPAKLPETRWPFAASPVEHVFALRHDIAANGSLMRDTS